MKRSNKLRRIFPAAAVSIAAGLLTFAGCTGVDDTLGSNLVPTDQQMKAGFTTLDGRLGDLNPRKLVETRLFQTDSIVGSNISYGYMGSMVNDTFGMRSAGFLSQYLSYYLIKEGYFGYKPIFDSAQIRLSIDSYGSDTLTDQTFGVYEIVSNDYLTEKPIAAGRTKRDTTFCINFDPEKPGYTGNIVGDKLFTFTIGQSNGTGPSTTAITMQPTQAGERFVMRLMLQEGTYKEKYSIYGADSLEYWFKEFKGLYIKPEQDQTASADGQEKGTIYATSLGATGFTIYGRSRVENNPSLIKDTLSMAYYFYDEYAQYGNVSVNCIRHDYTNAKFDIADAQDINPDGQINENRPENATLFVAGMGGVVSEITFTQEFFDQLQALLDRENKASHQNYRTLAFNQAKMSIYFQGSSYDWTQLPDIPHLVGQMNAAIGRLGLYTDYKGLKNIPDYSYLYEKNYGITIAYDGYVNRSHGCYEMNISAYMQALWNSYLEECASAAAENREIDLSKVENRSIYLAPEAYSLFTPSYSVLQGMPGTGLDGTENNASIRFDLTYNLIK